MLSMGKRFGNWILAQVLLEMSRDQQPIELHFMSGVPGAPTKWMGLSSPACAEPERCALWSEGLG